MNRKRITAIGLLSLTLAFGFTGCTDNSEEVSQADELENEVTSTAIQAEGEMEFESVFEVVEDEMAILAEEMETGRVERREHRLLPECATVSHDEELQQVTIDFGSENCLGRDGLYRRGRIIIAYEGPRREPGSSRTVTLEDYYVNDNSLTGTKSITNVTELEGQPAFDVVITDASYTNARGTVTWASNRHIDMIAGADTPRNPFDDILSITGSSSGVNRNGVAYTFSILEELIKKAERGCARTFIDGVVIYENENGTTWRLDYDPVGGQPCDRIGEVTVGDEVYTITLR